MDPRSHPGIDEINRYSKSLSNLVYHRPRLNRTNFWTNCRLDDPLIIRGVVNDDNFSLTVLDGVLDGVAVQIKRLDHFKRLVEGLSVLVALP